MIAAKKPVDAWERDLEKAVTPVSVQIFLGFVAGLFTFFLAIIPHVRLNDRAPHQPQEFLISASILCSAFWLVLLGHRKTGWKGFLWGFLPGSVTWLAIAGVAAIISNFLK